MDNEVKNITNRRHIGRNIQRIRVYLGMKQEALAADLGVSQNIISKIEKEPEIEEGLLNQLASALGISAEVMENDDLTTMQKHVLKFILLETMHRDLYQKDIEEEFQIRKPTVTGILKLMEKNGYIYRESAKQDARLKQIIPTEKAEKIRPAILKSIEEGEAKMLRGIPKEDVELCKQVLWQMYENRKKSCDSRNDF